MNENTTGADRSWVCVAYGKHLPDLCFFDQVAAPCANLSVCEGRMVEERKRLFQRVQELAAHGDPTMEHLAEQFRNPAELLNTSDEADDSPDSS